MKTRLASLALVALVLVGAASLSACTPQLTAVQAAREQIGQPYKTGGESRSEGGFDCSGLVRWSYARVCKHLPRTAQQQWAATRHIAPRYRRAGDLVFFFSGRHVYHVAMYAGHGYIWHAPKPGSRVKRVKLWTSHVRYGRVR